MRTLGHDFRRRPHPSPFKWRFLSLEHMLASMAEKPVAAAAGLFAMVCLATWPLFRTRPAMLGTYICNNLGFFVHYACSATGPRF